MKGSVLPRLLVIALLYVSLQAHLPVPAQVPVRDSEHYLVSSWSTESGLPQNSVTSIVQTRDGYLWLGTFGGVARFDGVRFVTYDSGNTQSLHSNGIQA